MVQNILVYKNLKDISAITFNTIKFEGDVKLIDSEYEFGKKYTPEQMDALKDAWVDLYDQYYLKLEDKKSKRDLKRKKENFGLLFKIKQSTEFLVILRYITDNYEYIPLESYNNALNTLLRGLKTLSRAFKWDANKSNIENIEYNQSVVDGLTTRYNRQKGDDDDEVDLEDASISTFYEIKASMEQWLEKNHIDENINMLEWIAYEKQFKRKIENANK